jgi:myosin-5
LVRCPRRFPTATGKDLAQKLYTAPSCTNSKRFSKPKTSQSAFTISHYAGGVTYECTHFLEKNKDFVVAEHQVGGCAAQQPGLLLLTC